MYNEAMANNVNKSLESFNVLQKQMSDITKFSSPIETLMSQMGSITDPLKGLKVGKCFAPPPSN
jgi:hypothetical protein